MTTISVDPAEGADADRVVDDWYGRSFGWSWGRLTSFAQSASKSRLSSYLNAFGVWNPATRRERLSG